MTWIIKGASEGFLLCRGDVELKVPATLAGIKVLNSVLLDLNNEKIGQSGFPTQHQLDEMISKWKAANPPKEPLVKVDLRALGLI